VRGGAAWTERMTRDTNCVVRAVAVIFCSLVVGCGDPPRDATPEGALEAFLDAMDRSEHDAAVLREAYAYLGPRSREELGRRAQRAASLAQREVEPWEMLAQGTFRLTMSTRDMEAEVEDGAGVVVVRQGEREARVSVVEVDEHWRVELWDE